MRASSRRCLRRKYRLDGFGEPMVIMRNHPLYLALAPLFCGFGAGACTNGNNPTVTNGACVVDAVTVDCTTDGLSAESLGLVPYSCTGEARPDQDPIYVDGVPQGLVCANQGTGGSDGTQGYCCSNRAVPCAYNPVAICDPGTYGYQCRGSNRPEALNDAIHCNQGVRQDDLINYCCSGAQRTAGCTSTQSVGCSAGMMGWICPIGTLPTAQDLAANQSRADVYYQLCPIPTAAANPKYENFCCYTPALVPPGGTCVQDTTVPNCQPGRFGMACYGPDTPDQNYPRLACPEPGFPGVSYQGYPATLYCCDFRSCVPNLDVPCQPGQFGFFCLGSDTPEGYSSRMHCPDPGFTLATEPGTLYCCDFQ